MSATTVIPYGPGVEPPLVRRARRLLLGLVMLLPGLLLLQFYLAGLFLMSETGGREVHAALGMTIAGIYPVVVSVVAGLAKAPRTFWVVFGALVVAGLIQAALPSLSSADSAGWLRAAHPVNGGLMVGLSVQQFQRVRRFVSSGRAELALEEGETNVE